MSDPRPRTQSPKRLVLLLVGGGLLALLLAAVDLWPTRQAGLCPLDDLGSQVEFADASIGAIWDRDRFGHQRPLKNLWWLAIAQHEGGLLPFRAGAFLAGAACAALTYVCSVPLFKHRGWALLSAAAWLLNPTTVTPLVWISAQNYLFCLAATLLFLVVGRRALTGERSDRLRLAYAGAAALCFLLAVFANQLGVLCPVLLWAYVRAVDKREHNPVGRRALLATLLSAGAVVSVVYLRAEGGAGRTYRLAQEPAFELAFSAARYSLKNLRLWFWQQGSFGILYSDTPSEHLAENLVAWAVALAALGLAYRLRADRVVRLGTLWTLLFLVPLSNLTGLGNTPVAPHYLVLPGVGLALLLARLGQWLASQPHTLATPAAVCLACLPLGAWQPEYRQTALRWTDPALLYSETIANHPQANEAVANLVALYLERRELDKAAALLAQALGQFPQDPMLIANQFQLLAMSGNLAAALAWLDGHPVLFELDPDMPLSRVALLTDLGRTDEAREALVEIVQSSSGGPTLLTAGRQLLRLYLLSEDRRQATALLERLLASFPSDQELITVHRLLNERR